MSQSDLQSKFQDLQVYFCVNTESPQIKAATCMAYALSKENLNVYSCFKRF